MPTFKKLNYLHKLVVCFALVVLLISIGHSLQSASTTDTCCLLGGAQGTTAGAISLGSTAQIDNTSNPPVFSVVGALAPGTGGYFVHNQPTCSTTVNYGHFYVFLSTAVTWGSGVTETGAVTPALAWCNGTTWTVVAK